MPRSLREILSSTGVPTPAPVFAKTASVDAGIEKLASALEFEARIMENMPKVAAYQPAPVYTKTASAGAGSTLQERLQRLRQAQREEPTKLAHKTTDEALRAAVARLQVDDVLEVPVEDDPIGQQIAAAQAEGVDAQRPTGGADDTQGSLGLSLADVVRQATSGVPAEPPAQAAQASTADQVGGAKTASSQAGQPVSLQEASERVKARARAVFAGKSGGK